MIRGCYLRCAELGCRQFSIQPLGAYFICTALPSFRKAPDCSVAGDFHLAACNTLYCNDFVLVKQISFCIYIHCLFMIT